MPQEIAAAQAAQKEAQAAQQEAQGIDVLRDLGVMRSTTLTILNRALRTGIDAKGEGLTGTEARSERRKQDALALQALDRWLKQEELVAKLTGSLAQEGSTTVNIWMSPEWTGARKHLLDTLRPFPEARIAVAQALLSIEEAQSGSPRTA